MYTGPSPARHPKRWPLIVTVVLLVLVAAVLGIGYAYSTQSAQEWRSSANATAEKLQAMTVNRDDLKSQVSDLQSKTSDLQVKLDDMTTEFNNSTDRIRSLSDEKAQVGDDAALLVEVLALSQNVTFQMDSCITDLQKLQTYLVDFKSYDSTSLIAYAGNINDGCNQARKDSAALSKKLGGS